MTFRSEAPGYAISFDGANHGNGYVNTGVLDANSGHAAAEVRGSRSPRPAPTAYYCAVHGNDMAGEIVVK